MGKKEKDIHGLIFMGSAKDVTGGQPEKDFIFGNNK